MKLRSQEPYWLLKNGLINSYPKLQTAVSCDVLIIGGGITGALMAYQLSSEGYQVVVIDKRDVAMGSTSGTTAMLQYELDEPLYSLMKKVGEDAAVDTYWEGVRAIQNLDTIVNAIRSSCGFGMKKSLYVAHNIKALRWLEKEFECRSKYDLPVSWLTKKSMKANGISGEGAILSSAGGSVDAYRLAHDLLAYSVNNFGLRVFDHTTSTHVEFNKSYQKITTDTGYDIDSKLIVFASGYETQHFLNKEIVELNSTYAVITEPLVLPPWLTDTILWNTETPYLYLRSTPDHRMIIGGQDEHFENATKRDRLIEEKEKNLLACAKELLPDLPLIADFAWAGTFGVTKDALPYIGEHEDYPGCFFVLGFGGNGIAFSVMGMRIISDAIAGRDNKFLDYYSFQRK